VRLAGVEVGDLVLVSKGGRHVYGEVVDVRQGVVHFRPLCRGVSWRHAGAREVVGHWRRAAGSAGSHDDYVPLPASQLSFAGKLERQ
jgi:hypothetical protein